MQENELPKNMGKKIVDALKQQDFETATENEDSLIDKFESTSDEISLDDIPDTSDNEAGFDFGTSGKDYQPVFSAQ